MLVEEQGELLNRIETKVNDTADYVASGIGVIIEVNRDREKSRKVNMK